MHFAKLTATITQAEGSVLYVYDDATGEPIVKGYTVVGQPTIGSGRLLTHDRGITDDERVYLLSNDITDAYRAATGFTCWSAVADNDARCRGFVELVYNLGPTRLQGFKLALGALQRRDYDTAANELLNSKWATQVGQRANRIAEMIRTGQDA